jgi:cell division protein FtsZ
MVAAERAISCALMEAGGVRGARGMLINITGSSRLGLHEVNEACTLIRNAAERRRADQLRRRAQRIDGRWK